MEKDKFIVQRRKEETKLKMVQLAEMCRKEEVEAKTQVARRKEEVEAKAQVARDTIKLAE